LPSERIIGYFMTFDEESEGVAEIPSPFVNMGYSSKFAIVNMGSSFVYLVVYLLSCPTFLVILLPLSMFSKKLVHENNSLIDYQRN
jgi:hypothetical protein